MLKGIVLVGGGSRGTRFRPLSLDVPKPLFPIAGHPLLYHPIKALTQVNGMSEIMIIGFYESTIFNNFVKELQSEFPKITIRYFPEYQSLGTAGGLYHFRDHILKGNPSNVFVLHVDVASSFPLSEMLEFHQSHGGVCTILGKKVSKEASRGFGCLVEDTKNSEVLHYVDKPETFLSDLVSCGIYVFRTNIFEEFKDFIANKERDEEGQVAEFIQLEQDVFPRCCGTKKLYVYKTDGFFYPIKTGGSAVHANSLYLEEASRKEKNILASQVGSSADKPQITGNVIIHPTAKIEACAKIGPNVSIGPNVIIGKGVRVRDSILLEDVEVKQFSCILNAVVARGCKIGQWARVEGTPTSLSIDDAPTNQGVKSQSITVLGDHVIISKEINIRNCIVLPNKELTKSFKNEILM